VAKKKEVEVPEKLSVSQLRAKIIRLRELSDAIDSLNQEWDEVARPVIDTLGPKGVLAFSVATVDIRCSVVASFHRPVPWRQIAGDLAKKLFPEKLAFRRWVRSLVKKFPKKPKKAFIRLTVKPLKEAE
jgi:hypothetical protein